MRWALLLLLLTACGTGPPAIYAEPVRIRLVLTPDWEDLARAHHRLCEVARENPALFPDVLEMCALYGLTTARAQQTPR